jgi:hypothetical protein
LAEARRLPERGTFQFVVPSHQHELCLGVVLEVTTNRLPSRGVFLLRQEIFRAPCGCRRIGIATNRWPLSIIDEARSAPLLAMMIGDAAHGHRHKRQKCDAARATAFLGERTAQRFVNQLSSLKPGSASSDRLDFCEVGFVIWRQRFNGADDLIGTQKVALRRPGVHQGFAHEVMPLAVSLLCRADAHFQKNRSRILKSRARRAYIGRRALPRRAGESVIPFTFCSAAARVHKPQSRFGFCGHRDYFFPLGNADTLRIDLTNGDKILVDYANVRSEDDEDDLRCDLARELWRDLTKAKRDYYNAVCITHLDDDHCKGFGEFFWLRHAKAYQGDGRAKINELWVPACAIIEEGLDGDARLVRSEARYRLREGKGIRVFSRPERLRDWMKENGIDYESRKHLFVDAGTLVPGYTKEGPAQAEFFVHCPFGWRQDETTVIDRNGDSIVMQVTFRAGSRDSYLFLGSDVDHEALSAIVQISKAHGNEDRLLWDLMKLFHHCSYLALGPERGTDETKTVEDVKWLFETQGRRGAVIVSPSWPIPAKGSKEDKDVQPPHRQAANHHRRVTKDLDGRFVVTMEQPSQASPKPFGYEITTFGIALIVSAPMVSSAAAASTPRAG